MGFRFANKILPSRLFPVALVLGTEIYRQGALGALLIVSRSYMIRSLIENVPVNLLSFLFACVSRMAGKPLNSRARPASRATGSGATRSAVFRLRRFLTTASQLLGRSRDATDTPTNASESAPALHRTSQSLLQFVDGQRCRGLGQLCADVLNLQAFWFARRQLGYQEMAG